MLAGILVEIAKHTNLSNMRPRKTVLLLAQCSHLFSLLRTQPNSLGISFDITRQFLMRLEFSRWTLLSRP